MASVVSKTNSVISCHGIHFKESKESSQKLLSPNSAAAGGGGGELSNGIKRDSLKASSAVVCPKRKHDDTPTPVTVTSRFTIKDINQINQRLKESGLDSSTISQLISLVHSGKVTSEELLEEETVRLLADIYRATSAAAINGMCLLKTMATFFEFVECELEQQQQEQQDGGSCSLLAIFEKWKSKQPTQPPPMTNGHGSTTTNSSSNKRTSPLLNHEPSKKIVNFMTYGAIAHYPGPNEEKLFEILNRTGYCMELSNGQRKYGLPASGETNSIAESIPNGSEIFVGRIPKEIFEDELIPVFETIGKIFDLRLMIDPMSGHSRGYAFITYFCKEHARLAVEKFDNHEIRKGKLLKVNISVPNVRLFIGNIPKEMSKENIMQEFQKHTTGLVDVIIYHPPNDRRRNRGFCFLEFETHRLASQAKRKLTVQRAKIWGAEIWVDWAEPLEEPDEETMAKVKVLYVRNLSTNMSEEHIKSIFQQFGNVERVKKIKDYAFVHFEERRMALDAMKKLNGKQTGEHGMRFEISLAKPPSDKKRKEEILRNRERRMLNMMQVKSMMIYQTIPSMLGHQGGEQSYALSSQPPPPPPPLLITTSPPHHHHHHHHHSDPPVAGSSPMASLIPLAAQKLVPHTSNSPLGGGSSSSHYYHHHHHHHPVTPAPAAAALTPQSAVARVTLAPPEPAGSQPHLLTGHLYTPPITTADSCYYDDLNNNNTKASSNKNFEMSSHYHHHQAWNWFNWYDPNSWWYHQPQHPPPPPPPHQPPPAAAAFCSQPPNTTYITPVIQNNSIDMINHHQDSYHTSNDEQVKSNGVLYSSTSASTATTTTTRASSKTLSRKQSTTGAGSSTSNQLTVHKRQ